MLDFDGFFCFILRKLVWKTVSLPKFGFLEKELELVPILNWDKASLVVWSARIEACCLFKCLCCNKYWMPTFITISGMFRF